jgi:hypothetical protein
MVAFHVVVVDVLVKRATKHRRAHRNEFRYTLFLNRTDESLRVGVQIRRARRQPNDPNALSLKCLPEARRIFGIAVHDEVSLIA